MRYALVKDGAILGFRSEAPNVDQSTLAEGKPRLLPVEVIAEQYDPVSKVLEGPAYEVEAARVVERYLSRGKSVAEIDAMRAGKDAEIEAEFQRLYNLPIAFSIGETGYTFHADDEARENITGILQMYEVQDAFAGAVAEPMPDPRPFTPQSVGPIMITRAQLGALGHAIGVRKDKLYVVKKTKQAALAGLTDAASIHAVDPLSGWEIE